jgi:hypothetical protein
VDRQYVGIDLHRRRSVVLRMSATGKKVSWVPTANDPMAIAAAAEAGAVPEVVVEAIGAVRPCASRLCSGQSDIEAS